MNDKNEIKKLCREHPDFNYDEIAKVYDMIAECFRSGNALYICGNGGSCADSGHITGELMKSFKRKRPIPEPLTDNLKRYGEFGEALIEHLEGAMPAISLCDNQTLISAFSNDAAPEMAYAQQLVGLALPGDTLLVISTSGNSKNCVYAAITAKCSGMYVVALTGANPCLLDKYSDAIFHAPATETYKIQEIHLPVYHAICASLETDFYFNCEPMD